jgi:hypothetical protein
MHATLSSLKDKKRYLEDQIKSYHVYIDQSMAGIQKKSKKRIVLPWSIQGVHQRQLEKQGKKYKFGSYKYTAQTLYERGVLLSIEQVSPKTFDKVSMTFSSDNVGVFEIKVEFTGKTLSAVELKLEDLLEAQWVRRHPVYSSVLPLTDRLRTGRQANRLNRRGCQDEPRRAARPHQPQVSRFRPLLTLCEADEYLSAGSTSNLAATRLPLRLSRQLGLILTPRYTARLPSCPLLSHAHTRLASALRIPQLAHLLPSVSTHPPPFVVLNSQILLRMQCTIESSLLTVVFA